MENQNTVPCACSNFVPKYIDKNHERPNWCNEPVNISWQQAKKQIFIGLKEYIKQLPSNKGISICNYGKSKQLQALTIKSTIFKVK